ncbi:MAG: hypothetical protein ACRDD4_11670 [Culicoidibacterales bacterium]
MSHNNFSQEGAIIIEENNKFHSLTPDITDNHAEIYTKALDYAFNSDDIKNIAITGIYGAGKSTIWKTYVNKKNIKKIITTSLGQYEVKDDEEHNNEQDDSPNSSNIMNFNRLERQLINQLLSQIKSSEIPLSKYHFKKNRSTVNLVLKIISTLVFLISIAIWILKDDIVSFLPNSINDIDINLIMLCVVGSLFFTPILAFLYSFYRENKVKISRINLQGAEANLEDENNDETVLDRDIKEIVYLLTSSKVEIVVFEDLDRYNNIEIFTKLRELNFLINSQIIANDEKRVVRFVYMLKDGLFFSKNRTKFFDFIVPIVPIIDSKTSKNQLVGLFKSVEHTPDKHVLTKISLYIDDMRLLKNIVNEYVIYSDIVPLKKVNLEKSKLFALVTLKNIFPNEFDALQEDKGYVRAVFDRLEKSRDDISRNLQNELSSIEEEIVSLQRRIEKNKFEAMALMVPADVKIKNQVNQTWPDFLEKWEKNQIVYSVIYYNNYNNFTYEQFIERFVFSTPEKQAEIDKIPTDKTAELARLNTKVQELNKKIAKVRTNSFKELITSMTLEQRDELFSSAEFSNIDTHYSPLIRFLITDGLLDETYWYYKGNLDIDTSETLKRNDIIYMKGLVEGNSLDPFLEVETPTEIVKELTLDDFTRFNILNKTVLKHCIDNEPKHVVTIAASVDANNNYDNLNKILDTFNFETIQKYVELLIESDKIAILENSIESCENRYTNAVENMLISLCTYDGIQPDELKLFDRYIEKNPEIISWIPEPELPIFIENISSASIKFEDLSEIEISKERLSQIERVKAYQLTIVNVIFIASKLLQKHIEYGNLLDEIYHSELLAITKEYLVDEFSAFICQYVDENRNGDSYTNSEAIVIEILTSDISDEYKVKYINNNRTILTNIQELESIAKDEHVFAQLLDKDLIGFTEQNMNLYWNMIEEYDEHFRNYLDRNLNEQNFESVLSNNSIANTLVNDSDISENVFELLLAMADDTIAKINANLPERRVLNLIEKKLIAVTDNNLEILLTNDYNSSIVTLVNENTDSEDVVITKLASSNFSENLAYMLINSHISDDNALKIVAWMKDNISIVKIDFDKKSIISKIISNELSNNNIDYICGIFETFELKEEFIASLAMQNKLMYLSNENLNTHVLNYILQDKNVSIDIKIELVTIKINNNVDVDQLSHYIATIEEIADIATVWNSKRPLIDNQYKQKICQALVDNQYAKRRGENRVQLH